MKLSSFILFFLAILSFNSVALAAEPALNSKDVSEPLAGATCTIHGSLFLINENNERKFYHHAIAQNGSFIFATNSFKEFRKTIFKIMRNRSCALPQQLRCSISSELISARERWLIREHFEEGVFIQPRYILYLGDEDVSSSENINELRRQLNFYIEAGICKETGR